MWRQCEVDKYTALIIFIDMYLAISTPSSVEKGTNSLQVRNQLGNKTCWVAITIYKFSIF